MAFEFEELNDRVFHNLLEIYLGIELWGKNCFHEMNSIRQEQPVALRIELHGRAFNLLELDDLKERFKSMSLLRKSLYGSCSQFNCYRHLRYWDKRHLSKEVFTLSVSRLFCASIRKNKRECFANFLQEFSLNLPEKVLSLFCLLERISDRGLSSFSVF